MTWCGEHDYVTSTYSNAQPSCFNVDALVFCQVGKTTAMQQLLTAIVSEHPVFGVGGESEVAVLQLDLPGLRVREASITTILC